MKFAVGKKVESSCRTITWNILMICILLIIFFEMKTRICSLNMGREEEANVYSRKYFGKVFAVVIV